MPGFDVERLARSDAHAAVAVLARAFFDDPLFNFFIPNLVEQSRGLLAFMGAGVTDAQPFGEVWVARTGNRVAGAAVWLPPDSYPRGARRDVMIQLRAFGATRRAGRRMAAALRLLTAVDKAHHAVAVPHLYLAILGVDPCFQRSGAGRALLAPVLARCDAEGLPAYLETQKEENLAYYARYDFALAEKLEIPGGPPIWTMLREPR